MRKRTMWIISLLIAVMAIVALAPVAQAQRRVRVVMQDFVTGRLTKSAPMELDIAMSIANGIAFNTPGISNCWLEQERKFHFLIPFLPPQRTHILRTRSLAEHPDRQLPKHRH